uniref:Uncharacterized protein n=1 Tax=Anopheles melas TaxID=34690 RepID=A0A182U3L1_9DIPT
MSDECFSSNEFAGTAECYVTALVLEKPFHHRERLHIVGRDAAEHFVVDERVAARRPSPDVIPEGVNYRIRHVHWGPFRVRFQQSEMLAEQELAQLAGVYAARWVIARNEIPDDPPTSPSNPGSSGITTYTRNTFFSRWARTMRLNRYSDIWFFTTLLPSSMLMKNWFSM